jgi:hypothetical protein
MSLKQHVAGAPRAEHDPTAHIRTPCSPDEAPRQTRPGFQVHLHLDATRQGCLRGHLRPLVPDPVEFEDLQGPQFFGAQAPHLPFRVFDDVELGGGVERDDLCAQTLLEVGDAVDGHVVVGLELARAEPGPGLGLEGRGGLPTRFGQRAVEICIDCDAAAGKGTTRRCYLVRDTEVCVPFHYCPRPPL